jgi:biopolymer transport protein ExbB/TolQ
MVVVFLFQKFRILRSERQRLTSVSTALRPLLERGDADALEIQAEQMGSLLGRRLSRLLGIWRSTQSSFQLERATDADADLYQLSLENSFSLVKVLLWAIPILGFIGTVIGMSQAVGSFDAVLGNADNVDGLKAGLTKVTSGLGTAFDTTYLALVISVLLAVPINLIERQEEQILSSIDGDIRLLVMSLSPTGDQAVSNSASSTGDAVTGPLELKSSELGELINEAFEQFLPDPSVLVAPAQSYADQLTEATLQKLTPLTTLVRDSVEGIAEARLSLQEQAEQVRSSMDGAAHELTASVQSLEPLLAKLNQAAALSSVLGEDLDQLKATIELRRSIEALNASVLELKQQQSRRRSLLRWIGNDR